MQLRLDAQKFLLFVSLMEVTPMPVQRETTSSMSSRVTMPVEASSSLKRSRSPRRFSFSLRSSSE